MESIIFTLTWVTGNEGSTTMNVTEKVWREYHSKLLTFIAKRVDDRATADDILQDVFVNIHSPIDSLNEKTKSVAGDFRLGQLFRQLTVS